MDIQSLLDENVAPWVDKLPWQADFPVRFDSSEGYAGDGIMGARSGPMTSISFSNVAHELAHAFEIKTTKGEARLSQKSWGLRIRTCVNFGGQYFFEPVTTQASERECRVAGIQKRIMEMVGHPEADGLFDYSAEVFLRFMPDWIQGGDDRDARKAHRLAVMESSYQEWPAQRLIEEWPAIHAVLFSLEPSPMKGPLQAPRINARPKGP